MSRAPAASGREVFAWCLYDFANSAFTTIIVTVAYSVYFTEVVAPSAGEAWWGRGYALSMLLIGLLSPVLGAVADRSGDKRSFLIGFTLLSVAATALLFFVGRGDLWLGLALFIVANIGFNGANTFYDAFLKDVAPFERMGRISGYAWALGYIGGLASLLLVLPLLKGGFAPENLAAYRASFVVTAGFFLIFALPALLWVRDRPVVAAGRLGWVGAAAAGFGQVRRTFGELRRFRELFKFFIAYLIYNDGISTVIVFAAIFARKVLDFSPQDLIVYFIVMQLSSAAGAAAFGPVTDRLGGRRTILITLGLWSGVVLAAYFVQTQAQFYALGLLAGLALGSSQSASRTLLARFAPRQRSGEFFGFFSLTGKFAAVIGPLVYGEVAGATGDQRLAVLAIGLFFVGGAALLATVREDDGMAAARAAESGGATTG